MIDMVSKNKDQDKNERDKTITPFKKDHLFLTNLTFFVPITDLIGFKFLNSCNLFIQM